MNLLNLGCGLRFSAGWTNVDFVSQAPEVMACNLLKGIPFADATFDVVYHSHVLEHFSREDANGFIKECYRVLKPGGIIRVVVPDLESIINQYIHWRAKAQQGDSTAQANYNWIMLEMYDQCIRHYSGGEMGKYLTQPHVPNEEFVRSRLGDYYDIARRQAAEGSSKSIKTLMCKTSWVKKIYDHMTGHLPSFLARYKVGKFRLGGEPHLWMYDSYSLERPLLQCFFTETRVCSANESKIANWSAYLLDTDADGTVYKKDSLYIEAFK